ncbi:MAG: peptidoglycan-binding domain-containing protein [Planctomycetota bacterium]|jgi:hypothetical protein
MEALEYNKSRGYSAETIRRIQVTVGCNNVLPFWTDDAIAAVRGWQEAQELEVDGKIGPNTLRALEASWTASETSFKGGRTTGESGVEWKDLDADEKDRLVSFTVRFEGGGKEPYSACNRDGEWRGLFDRPKKDRHGKRIPVEDRTKRHWASRYNEDGGTHIGLSFGAWQTTQRAGTLGRVLRKMNELDPETFVGFFGGSSAAQELLATVSAEDGPDVGGRNPRVQKVQGDDLWEAPWLERFRAAGRHEACRRAQREVIGARFLNRTLKVAKKYGFDDQGTISVLFDIAIQFGVGGMTSKVRKALGKPSGTRRDQNDIEKVIDALPKARRKRRRKILAAAERNVHYVW